MHVGRLDCATTLLVVATTSAEMKRATELNVCVFRGTSVLLVAFERLAWLGLRVMKCLKMHCNTVLQNWQSKCSIVQTQVILA